MRLSMLVEDHVALDLLQQLGPGQLVCGLHLAFEVLGPFRIDIEGGCHLAHCRIICGGAGRHGRVGGRDRLLCHIGAGHGAGLGCWLAVRQGSELGRSELRIYTCNVLKERAA